MSITIRGADDIYNPMTRTMHQGAIFSLVENAGWGAGMDELSVPQISTERDIYEWIRTGLLPMLQGVDWYDLGLYADDIGKSRESQQSMRFQDGVREQCGGVLAEDCQQSWYPRYEESERLYVIAQANRAKMRKYNRLLGGIRIAQYRNTLEKCADRSFLNSGLLLGYAPFSLPREEFAPAYKCYVDRPIRYDHTDYMAFDYLYPRGHAAQVCQGSFPLSCSVRSRIPPYNDKAE
jgi:hypothetical protein